MPGAFFIGDWRVDPSLRTFSSGKGELHLEPKQMQVLVLLAEHAGQVVSKERLLQTVWADTFVGDEVLSRAISELRRAFDDDPKAPRFIQTIPKAGYRLVAPVRFLSVSDAAAQPQRHRPWWRRPSFVWSVLAGTLVTTALVAVVYWRHANVAPVHQPLITAPFTSLPGYESNPTFSPDGSRIAFEWNGRIYVKIAGDDPPQPLTDGPDDAGPDWSPDGRSVVFIRSGGDQPGFYVIPALGGPTRRVYAIRWITGRETCWSVPKWAPDGTRLIFVSAPPGDLPTASTSVPSCRVTELSLQTFQTRYLTGPLSYGFDSVPAYSPDGRKIAFVRFRSIWLADLFVMPSAGGTPRQLTHDDTLIPGTVAWMPDSQSIVFASGRTGSNALWRIRASGGEPEALGLTGGYPTVDASGHRLAFVRGHVPGCGIYVADIGHARDQFSHVLASSGCDASPEFSPDGRKLAFSSNRAGGDQELWIADGDGSNPIRLTFFRHGQTSTPRWSPDSQWIAFDSSRDTKYGVFLIRAQGGSPTLLTDDGFVPSWSRDGRSIYFASGRSGTDQIWKMSSAGGKARQVTRKGGFGGFESIDGRYLYYTKHTNLKGIWRVPVDGGLEEPVLSDQPAATFSRYFAVVATGLYFLDCSKDQRAVAFYDFTTRQRRRVLMLPRPVLPWESGMDVSPDGRRLAIDFSEGEGGSDIFLVENFH